LVQAEKILAKTYVLLKADPTVQKDEIVTFYSYLIYLYHRLEDNRLKDKFISKFHTFVIENQKNDKLVKSIFQQSFVILKEIADDVLNFENISIEYSIAEDSLKVIIG